MWVRNPDRGGEETQVKAVAYPCFDFRGHPYLMMCAMIRVDVASNVCSSYPIRISQSTPNSGLAVT